MADSTPPPAPPIDDATQARNDAKGLIKEVILEVIAEREAAPPKSKPDFLATIFGK
ncbi:MAG: hypothetical protein ACREN8_08420 [Candidatus Dormibacteraceae bacterium]